MASLQHSGPSSVDGAPDGDDMPGLGPRSVGEALRQRREILGLDLDDVAAVLRIKPAYLAALETGRPDRLPELAYALGFLRAYARYLGLDSDEMLQRFKQGAIDFAAKPDLSFLMRLDERNASTHGALLVAVILAICGCGTWYYLSTGEDRRLERVGQVPAELLPQLTASRPTEASAAALPSGNTRTSTDPSGAGSDSGGPSIAHPGAVVPLARDAAPTTSGIVVHAIADSWGEIRGARGSVLVARVLTAGESYRVPDQPGLSMRTRNPRGLEITIDGNPVPPIGRKGMALRHLALDRQALITHGPARH